MQIDRSECRVNNDKKKRRGNHRICNDAIFCFVNVFS